MKLTYRYQCCTRPNVVTSLCLRDMARVIVYLMSYGTQNMIYNMTQSWDLNSFGMKHVLVEII